MRPQGKVSRIKRCKEKHTKRKRKGDNSMMDDMKKNLLNEQELNQVAGGGIIEDVKDVLEIAEKVAEMVSEVVSAVTGGSEGTNENQNSDIKSHGSGASGSWNENSDIKSHGSGASGSW